MAIGMPDNSAGQKNKSLLLSVIGSYLGPAGSAAGQKIAENSNKQPLSIGANTNLSSPDSGVKTPDQMDKEYNPIDTRMTQMTNDPMPMVHQTLTALQDPSVPQEYRDILAEPLLKMKHFGVGSIG